MVAPRHVMTHGMTMEEYRAKWPEAQLIDASVIKKQVERQTGKKHVKPRSVEARTNMSRLKKEQYTSDLGLKDRVSEGTKIGMHVPEAWEKFKQGISERDTSGFGKRFKSDLPETKAKMYTSERNTKVASGKSEWWADGRIGKTVEELWGKEKGASIRAIKSSQTRGELNPAYGKVYEGAGRGKVGRYKGQLFRSTWEYSFYKYLEMWGLDIENTQDVKYEHLSIPFMFDDRKRTYHPDFLLVGCKALIEVKTKNELGREDKFELLAAKFAAAHEYCEKNGLIFRIMTEQDFPIIKLRVIKTDPDVEWIRR